MFYRELIYQAVIFSAIKPMEQKRSELTLPSKMQNTQFRQRKTILTRGIVITGCIRNVIWLSVFSIKSKLFAELLLVMISLLHRFLLSYTLLPFGFCLNDTTLLSFQIRSSIITQRGICKLLQMPHLFSQLFVIINLRCRQPSGMLLRCDLPFLPSLRSFTGI